MTNNQLAEYIYSHADALCQDPFFFDGLENLLESLEAAAAHIRPIVEKERVAASIRFNEYLASLPESTEPMPF